MAIEFFKKLSNDLTNLLENGEDYNVLIEVGQMPNHQIFKVHSIILNSRCFYFRETLNKTIRDEYDVKKIKVTNTSVTVFEIIIKYIYGGIILFNEIDAPTILDLMATAKEYGLKELGNAAQVQLVNNHGWWLRQNFIKVYNKNFENNDFKDFQQFCNDIIANHSSTIFDSEDYVNLSERALVSILKLDNLNMEEGKIWDQVIRWGVAQNPDLDSNPTQWSNENFLTLKATLKNCIPYIRYFQFTGEDVMDKLYPYQQIFDPNLWRDIMSKLAAPNRTITSIILPPRIISNTVSPPRSSVIPETEILVINNIDAPSEHIDGGISISMNITNTSQIKVELNNMSFDIKYMNQIIGKVFSSFSNDNNILSFNGRLLPSNTKEKLDAMTNAFFKILSGEELKFTFEARTSSDSWLSSLNVIITKETKINFNYEFIERGWNFKFDPNEQYSPEISLQHEIKYSNLFPLGIYKISCKIILIYKDSQFATLNIPYTTVSNSLGTIKSNFTTKLEILTEDFKDSFNELVKKIFTLEDIVFTVKGELNVKAKTPVGDINMEKIQFNFDKNFKYQTQPRILIKSMEIVKATRDTIEFKGLATIINSLNVEIELRSNVEFDLLSDQNIKVANMTIENFKLKRKNEDMIVKLKYFPEYDSGHSVIKNYLNRRFSILSIKTNNQTTSVFLLQKFFEVLELKVLLPGIDALFIKKIEVSLNTKSSFMFHNPFKTKIFFFSLNSKVINRNNRQIATAIINPSQNGIVIESGETKKIQIEKVNMDVGYAIVNSSTDYFSGVRENIKCFVMAGIGEDKDNLFRINLNYTQENVKIIWALGFLKF